MAKRKRLEMPAETVSPVLETKSALAPGAATRARMPIAEVAGDTAGRAALEEVARAMTEAEGEGRVVKKLPLDRIDIHHLNRDRMVFDAGEMEALKASLAERGQQTPIDVVRVPGGRYGLISGLRRIEALKSLGQAEVLALVRKPESAADAYVAMIEENEIRAALSFYERANIAVTSVGAGVYPDTQAAVAGLFAHAPAAKRSKIARFLVLRRALGAALTFPAAIPEKLGLALAAAIEADKGVARRITETLRKSPPADASAERRVLERALKPMKVETPPVPDAAPSNAETALKLKTGQGRAVITGPGVDAAFLSDLRAWIAARSEG